MNANNKAQPKRAAGFYVTLFAALMCVASAIVYSACFRGVVYTHGSLFSDPVFYGLIAASVISVALLFVSNLGGFAPVVLCLASGLSCLVYIHHMLWPIADIFTAIDPVTFTSELITCGVLLVASFVLAEVALYMKKSKKAVDAV